MPKLLNIVYNAKTPAEQLEEVKKIQQEAANFDSRWKNMMQRELARLKTSPDVRLKADGSLDFENYGLPENTSDEMLFALLSSWYMRHGIEIENILAEDNELMQDGLQLGFKKGMQCYDFLRQMGMEEHKFIGNGVDAPQRIAEDRLAVLNGTFIAVNNSPIPVPQSEDLHPETFFRDAARARMLNQIAKAEPLFTGFKLILSQDEMNQRNLTAEDLEKIIAQAVDKVKTSEVTEARGTTPYRSLGKNQNIAQGCEDLYNALLHVFSQPAFGGENQPMKASESDRHVLNAYYENASLLDNPGSFFQLTADTEKSEAWPLGPNQRKNTVKNADEVLTDVFGESLPETTFVDMDTRELLRLVTNREINSEDDISNALEDIYINGRSLKGMSEADAVNALKSSLYADSPDVPAIRGENGLTAIDLGYAVTIDKTLNFAGEAMNALDQKRKQNTEYIDYLNQFSMETKGDVNVIQVPDRGNMTSAQYLSKVTGMAIDAEKPESLRSALQSIYIDGQNLADNEKYPDNPADINLDEFAQNVERALDKRNNSFVTIMHKNSVIPDPRAVIPEGNLNDPEIREKVNASVGFARNYSVGMAFAAGRALKKCIEIRDYNTALFQSSGTPPLIIPGLIHMERTPYSVPSLFMMSRGYSMEDVFGNDPRLEEDKRKMGELFYEIFSCRKDKDGNYLPPDDPVNIEYYKDVVRPAITKMAETMLKAELPFADINDKKSLDQLYLIGTFLNSTMDFGQNIELDCKDMVIHAGLAAQILGYVVYEPILRYLRSDMYKTDGKIQPDNNNILTPALVAESIHNVGGNPKAFKGLPLGAFPAEEGIKHLMENSGMAAMDRGANYEEIKKTRTTGYTQNEQNATCLQFMKKFINNGRELAALRDSDREEYDKRISKMTYELSAGLAGDPGSDRELDEYVHALQDRSPFGMISFLAGVPLDDKNPVKDQIDAALEKLYINGQSLKERYQLDGSSDISKLQNLNTRLKHICNDIFEDGKTDTAILLKDKENVFRPVGLNLNGQLKSESAKNYFKDKGSLRELIEKNKDGKAFSVAVAKQMNNQKLSDEDKKILTDNKFRPATWVEKEDIHDLFAVLNGKPGDRAERGDFIKAADKIYINNKSFYEYFDIERDKLSDDVLEAVIAKAGLQNLMESPDPTRLVMMKNNDGSFTPVTRGAEPVPDIKPVAPLGFFQRLSTDNLEKHNAAVAEYDKAMNDHREKNQAIEKYNETARVYARALNGQILSKEEAQTLETAVTGSLRDHSLDGKKKLEFPHPELYAGTRPAGTVHRTTVDMLAEHRPENNSRTRNGQARDNSHLSQERTQEKEGPPQLK